MIKDFEEGRSMRIRMVRVYRAGHTDGYKYFFSGPVFRSAAEADAVSLKENGGYAVKAEECQALETDDGRLFLLLDETRYAEAALTERALREAALTKLTADERRLLGLKG